MIDTIRIFNFKSIRDLTIYLEPINILVGGNGVGKSNVISFFQLLHQLQNQNLRGYVAENGGADNLLYFGRKTSSFLGGQIYFENTNAYAFALKPDLKNGFYFESETDSFNPYYSNLNTDPPWEKYKANLGKGHTESLLKNQRKGRYAYLNAYFNQIRVYHFHDTSASSPVKQSARVGDNETLREDGGNLAAFLYLLQEKHPTQFKTIEATIRSIAPFFQRFDLAPDRLNPEYIQLEWKEESSDMYFNAHNLSDGTLRMMCLVTLLLQPDLPKTIIIDEPELGLHPFAINKLAGLMRSASTKSQLIVSTQSVNLIDNFTPKDIIVVDRKDRQSVFTRLNENDLKEWLETYSLGELWDKNVIGGRP